MYDNLSRVIEVDIDEILPNRFQPRIQFDEEEILELSDSIKEHGVIQPLVVRTIGDKYEIIAGERRYKASVLAGKETVPVIVKNLSDKDSAEIALIENIQRKNLTPIEEALSYKKILDMGYLTQENLASKLGKSQPAVANKIRLLNLSDEVQEALLENKISERHARSLLKLTTSKQQNEMLNRIITERLTVRKADEEIEKMKNNISEENNNIEQKIIEKGEIDMNNNMFGVSNVSQNTQQMPNFDIFGGSTPVEQSVVTPVQETRVIPQTPNFDIFGGNIASPAAQEVLSVPTFNIESQPATPHTPSFDIYGVNTTSPTMQEVPTMPTVEEPSVSVFNIEPQLAEEVNPPSVSGTPEYVAPAQPEALSVPTFNIESQPATPQTPGFDIYGVNTTSQMMQEVPTMPTVEEPSASIVNIDPHSTFEVPQTAPIMESPIVENNKIAQQSENLFSFGDVNYNSQEPATIPQETSIVPEFKMPEPIIITDYSKQYDPVMPITPETMHPTVDFKEVINAIRECSNKIEQYGFKIDVEEYDLTNLYQVIFKIEK